MQVSKSGWIAGFLLLVGGVTGCEESVVMDSPCQADGQAIAAELVAGDTPYYGQHAIGGPGDFVLQNDVAGFVIEGVDRGTSYYHYGGIVVDAVGMKGCEQAGPDEFMEAGLLVGDLNLGSVYESNIRAFRATKVEVINDGSDGKAAVVRATGVDDYYWLVEYTMINEAFNAGEPRKLSQPYGITVAVDYILKPGSPVLEMDVTFTNESGEELELLMAQLLIFGDGTSTYRFADSNVELEGFSFAIDIPWITAGTADASASYAYTISDSAMATAYISGVQVLVDVDQALKTPLQLDAAGGTAQMAMLLAAVPGDGQQAGQGLRTTGHDFGFEDATEKEMRLQVQAPDGSAVTDAVIDLEMEDGDWKLVDRIQMAGHEVTTRSLWLPLGSDGNYRMVARSPSRGVADPVPLDSAGTSLTLGAAGTLRYEVRDTEGRDLPAKISLYQDGERTHRFWVWGIGSEPVPPGTYIAAFTRGYEYEPVSREVVIPPDGSALASVVLERVVDTKGYMSIDTHVHSGPSADSKVTLAERVRNAAAEGLEIPVATDHEAIIGMQPDIDALGLNEWVATVTGEEVTATLPEHLTMFPSQPDGTPQGGPVVWYGLGLPELYDAMRARGYGDTIAMINHPSILSTLQWDRVAGAPGIDNYEDLQMTKSKQAWSWEFDGIEVMNGTRSPFRSGVSADSGTRFDNWMSFHNHGHRIVGTGASDAHGPEDLGMPASWIVSPTDKPSEFTASIATSAYKNGQVMMTTGAFARVSVSAGGASAGLGELLTAKGNPVELDLQLQAVKALDVTHFRVYANCDEIIKMDTTDPDAVVKFDASVPLTLPTDAHIVVAAFGENPVPLGIYSYNPLNVPRVLTNPVYVDIDGNGEFDPPGGKECDYTLD